MDMQHLYCLRLGPSPKDPSSPPPTFLPPTSAPRGSPCGYLVPHPPPSPACHLCPYPLTASPSTQPSRQLLFPPTPRSGLSWQRPFLQGDTEGLNDVSKVGDPVRGRKSNTKETCERLWAGESDPSPACQPDTQMFLQESALHRLWGRSLAPSTGGRGRSRSQRQEGFCPSSATHQPQDVESSLQS